VEALLAKVLRDRVYYETSGGGVTASGGEAMVWADFIARFFASLRAEKIPTALDTSGVVGGPALDRVLANTDLVLIDLKIMDEAKHREIIGAPLPPILEHIRQVDRAGLPIIFRVPVVPGYTDGADNLAAMAAFVGSLTRPAKVELLPYHRMGEAKYRHLGRSYSLSELRPPSAESMHEARDVFTRAGIQAQVAGED
jgi:pyruvate formate lyase activating enzyme